MSESFELGLMIKAAADGVPGAHMDAVAIEAARSRGGDDRSVLEAYARAHANAKDYSLALEKARARLSLGKMALTLIAALLGASAVASALVSKADASLNVFWLLGALLGPSVLSLLIWLVLLWRRPRMGEGLSFAAMAQALARRFLPPGDHSAAAADVIAQQNLAGALGRWRISLASQRFWLTYLLAACAVFVLMMSFQRYVFTWETTLLSPSQAVALFDVLRGPVAALGLPAPSLEDIREAQRAGDALPLGQNSQVWAQFVLALLALYGVLPRLIAWAISKVFERRTLDQQTLSSADPFFAAIAAQIYQPAASVRVVDPDETSDPDDRLQMGRPGKADVEGLAIAGWEVESEILGNLKGFEAIGTFEREDALNAALAGLNGRPAGIAVSLLNTPDRGIQRVLRSAKECFSGDLTFVLLDQPQLLERLSKSDADRRIADWWSLLMKLGAAPEHVVLPSNSGEAPDQ